MMRDEMTPDPEDLDGTDNSTSTPGESEPSSEVAPSAPPVEQVEGRAHLLPEEEHAGSADREAQAEAILDESERRQHDDSGTDAEHRRSDDVIDPPD
jgi:hypothetical protein